MAETGVGLEAEGVTLDFGGVDVLDRVNVLFRAGEVHALTGENGAGKSSLAKVVAGMYKPREGTLTWQGAKVKFRNPREALAAGIALIHQEPLLFPDLDVGENVFAGNLPRKAGRVDWQKVYADAKKLLERVGSSIDPRRQVRGLSVADQQRVELAAALAYDAKLWIFDETTAPLTPKEAAELFGVIRGLRDRGCAVAIVTHHLDEVFAIADRITVLRDGRKVAEKLTAETSRDEIVRLMVGRDLEAREASEATMGEPVLTVQGLSGPGFQDVSFEIRRGEVFALAGLVGAGRTEVARVLFGMTRPTSGRITRAGKTAAFGNPRDAIRAGLALVPEDRRQDGLMLGRSVRENSALAVLPRLARAGLISVRRERTEVLPTLQRLKTAMADLDQPAGTLSGGNQQKVVLTKWLLTRPEVLILDEPTRGIDVGAKAEVHHLIRELAAQGLAVILISSDLAEPILLADRIGVMRRGRLVATLPGKGATEEGIMEVAASE